MSKMKKTRKPGSGRKKLKPEYDAGKNLKEQMDAAVALYGEDCSLQSIADAIVLNPIKVRKLLITAGVYESDVAKKVKNTFEEYRETQDYKTSILSTAKALNLSKASVTSYLPYQKGVYFATVYYGDGFERTGEIMVLLAVTVVFLGCGNVVRTQFLIPMKQDKAYIYSAVIGAVVNLVINSLLIPRYAAVGAAIGTIAAELCVLIYQLFYCRRELNLLKFAGYELVFCIFGLLMVVLIKVLPDLGSSMINLIVGVVIGGGFYIVLVAFYLVKFQKFRIPCLKK